MQEEACGEELSLGHSPLLPVFAHLEFEYIHPRLNPVNFNIDSCPTVLATHWHFLSFIGNLMLNTRAIIREVGVARSFSTQAFEGGMTSETSI